MIAWKFMVQFVKVPLGITDCISDLWALEFLSSSTIEDEDDEAEVVGSRDIDNILELFLFCSSDTGEIKCDKVDSLLCLSIEQICWVSTPAWYKCITVEALTQ